MATTRVQKIIPTTEQQFSQADARGQRLRSAREDHTHGTPGDPATDVLSQISGDLDEITITVAADGSISVGLSNVLIFPGSIATPVKTITSADSPYSVLPTDSKILIDASGGSVTVDLPSAAGAEGREYTFVATDVTNTITLAPAGSETIAGDATMDLLAVGEALTLFSDNTGWWAR